MDRLVVLWWVCGGADELSGGGIGKMGLWGDEGSSGMKVSLWDGNEGFLCLEKVE